MICFDFMDFLAFIDFPDCTAVTVSAANLHPLLLSISVFYKAKSEMLMMPVTLNIANSNEGVMPLEHQCCTLCLLITPKLKMFAPFECQLCLSRKLYTSTLHDLLCSLLFFVGSTELRMKALR
jgi:hypothetical protein